MISYRPDIDALRAIAVILVVAFHAFPQIIPSGFIGVDIFFVISGYLVTSIIIGPLSSGSFSITTFYARRIRRIFPALILVLMFSLGLGWLKLLPPELKGLGRHVSAASVFLSNFILGTETGYFDQPANTKPMLHLWSLSIEEQFYLIWPLVLFGCAKMYRSKISLGILWVVIAIATASFIHGMLLLQKGSTWAFYMPTARFWELMLGAALATWHFYRRPAVGSSFVPNRADTTSCSDIRNSQISQLARDSISVLGVLLLIVGFVHLSLDPVFPGYKALYPTLGAASLIASGPTSIVNRILIKSRLLVGIGLISYPLYLWHWPLLSIFNLADFGASSIRVRGCLVLLSFAFAWLTYKLVEQPIRTGGFGRTKAGLLIVLIGVVGLFGHYVYRQDGFVTHLSPLVRSFYFYEFKRGPEWRSQVCFKEEYEALTAPDYEKCTDRSPNAKAPKVYLWGDSHAASLYPALSTLAGDPITLTQVTTAICPPLLDQFGARKGCNEQNQLTVDRIIAEKPDVVILAGNWRGDVYQAVSSLLKLLKASGIKTVILVGRPPFWKKLAPFVIATDIQADPLKRIRRRFNAVVEPDDLTIKNQLKKAAEENQVDFVSPYDLLCNERGCLAVTGDTIDSVVTGDLFHLTEWGATLVLSGFPRFWCDGSEGVGANVPEGIDLCRPAGDIPALDKL